MVVAASAQATGPEPRYRVHRPTPAHRDAHPNAWSDPICLVGSGLHRVLIILASCEDSAHWFQAFAAPAQRAVPANVDQRLPLPSIPRTLMFVGAIK